MELRDYLQAVRRHWVLVAVAVALALGATLVAAALRDTSYRSTTVLFVSFDGATSQDSAEQRLGSYAELVRGPRVALAVGISAGLPDDRLRAELTAERVPGTALLTVVATDPSREKATAMAAAVPQMLRAVVTDLERGTPKSVIGVAQAPVTKRVPGQLPLSLALALLLGLVAGLAAVAVREFAGAPVGGAGDLRRRFGVEMVETIAADDPPSEAYRRLRTRLNAQAPSSGRLSLLVTGAGRDDRADTTCWSLAAAFAETGTSVVVVDADLRAEHPAPAPGLTDVLDGSRSIVDVLRTRGLVSAVRPGPIPADPGAALAAPALREAIGDLENMFDVVLVLAPPVLGAADAAVLATITGGAVVSVCPGRTRATELDRALETLRAVGADVVAAMLHPRRDGHEPDAVPMDGPPPSDETRRPSPRPVSELRADQKASLG